MEPEKGIEIQLLALIVASLGLSVEPEKGIEIQLCNGQGEAVPAYRQVEPEKGIERAFCHTLSILLDGWNPRKGLKAFRLSRPSSSPEGHLWNPRKGLKVYACSDVVRII